MALSMSASWTASVGLAAAGLQSLLKGAIQMPRTSCCAIEFWPILDPSLTEGSCEAQLDAYRTLRDDLLARLRRRFPPARRPGARVRDLHER